MKTVTQNQKKKKEIIKMCNEIKPTLKRIVIYYYCITGKTLYNDFFKGSIIIITMMYK